MAEVKTAKIKIHKTDRASGPFVSVGVNGQIVKLAVDQEITVPEAHLEALKNSDIKHEVVGGEEGVSTSSTAPLTDTATRDIPAVDPLLNDKDGKPLPVPELNTGDPKHDAETTGVGGANAVDQERSVLEAQQPGANKGPEADKPKPAAKRKPAAKKAAA